jgi:uncharacterized DUF497 family protein
MYMTITWDPRKAETNFKKHGVRFSDAEIVLWDPQGITIEDNSAKGEQRLVTIGGDALGRVLVVVFTYQGEEIRLISARKATNHERRVHEEGV